MIVPAKNTSMASFSGSPSLKKAPACWARPKKGDSETARYREASADGSEMGLSENVVYPIKNPMVLLIIIPMKNGYFIGGMPHFQTYPDDVEKYGVFRVMTVMSGYDGKSCS